ncbi:hypothetical protein [Chitinophaga ginsengisegetis]|uniref:hypothetical protein n=1 Tax=Chitinophaga ginsengisegetis TaxID=393003 RepID=UPI000DEA75E5|nr:hypothetical protein [Chitinophaga ginsengisegetis]MDR6569835.1 hypothetical protein [Chitinophaga ginsengisegetis]MDR6649568.1 hypothetical protein [Chitinophaga ginsengisegetis]MDR6655918.1 hypothetical protein [Chitinophaga ginsengisegetis]
MMKKLIFYIGLMLLGMSCKVPMGGRDNSLMKQVYQNQKSYYDIKISSKKDYISIINFGSKGREELYKKNGIQLSGLRDYIVLEGFNPGWGNYRGLLISDKGSYTYRNNATGKWDMELINIDSDDVEKKAGIERNIIDKVRLWDTLYINNQRKQLGAYVTDGFVFMATRVQYVDSHNTKIETMAFNEFAH